MVDKNVVLAKSSRQWPPSKRQIVGQTPELSNEKSTKLESSVECEVMAPSRGDGDRHQHNEDEDYQMIEYLVEEDVMQGVRTGGKQNSSFVKPQKRAKSTLWVYFKKVDSRTATCKLCQKLIRTSGNTSNLAKHLRVHKEIKRELVTRNSYTITHSKQITETPLEELSPVQITKPMIIKEVNNLTGQQQIINEQTEEEVILPKTRKPKNDNMDILDSRNAEITNCLLYFMCADNQPFNTVQGKGFKNLLSNIAPLYKIPTRDCFKKLLDEKYESMQMLYMEKISAAPYVSFSCDILNDIETYRDFLTVTVHFIDKCDLTSACLGVYELTDHLSSDSIGDNIKELLSVWNIDKTKVVAVVTSNTDEMVNAVIKRFGKNKHIPCFVDSINHIAEYTFNHPTIISLLEKVRSFVNWIKNNWEDDIRIRQLSSGIDERHLKEVVLDTKKGWKSIYYMLERFIELQSIFYDMIAERDVSPSMPSDVEMVTLRQLILILKPLEHMIKEISECHPQITISKVIPMINCLTKYYTTMEPESDTIILLKRRVWSVIEKRFGQIEFCPTFALSTLLDPRFKNVNFHDQNAINRARKNLLLNLENTSVADVVIETSSADESEYDFWSHHKSLVYGGALKKNKVHNKTVELTLYLTNTVLPLTVNPLAQWEEMKSAFPALYELAMKYFTVPVSSSLENLFSTAIAKSGEGFTGNSLSKLLFLGSCKEEVWF